MNRTGAIDASTFNSKTKAALRYYASANGLNEMIDTIYYVADDKPNQYEYSEGSTSQTNPAHIVEFIAASAVLHFATLRYGIHNANAQADAFEFAVMDDHSNAAGQINAMTLQDFYNATHNLLLDNLSTFALAMKYYRDAICGSRPNDKVDSQTRFIRDFNLDERYSSNRGTLYQDLDNFIEGNDWCFYAWIDELRQHDNHKLDLYHLDSNTPICEILAHHLYKDPVIGTTYTKIKDSLDKETRNSTDAKNDTLFFKLLRDVCKRGYQSTRNGNHRTIEF